MRKINLTGHVYGRLTVIRALPRKGTATMWECRCECGKITAVSAANLRSGNTKSCGCLNREHLIAALTTHGKTAGDSKPRLYRIWSRMKERCGKETDSNYHYYGGRGIKVCPEWEHNFQAFYDWAMANGYRDDLTIDRINVNGDYEPGNCRWVTQQEQVNNTRVNHYLEYNGQRKTMAEWARAKGISYGVLHGRVARGWDIKQALETPARGTDHEQQKEGS